MSFQTDELLPPISNKLIAMKSKTYTFLCLGTLGELLILLLYRPCSASTLHKGNIYPGFQGAQMTFIDRDGIFLYSNSSEFAFGFFTIAPDDVTRFTLSVNHQSSQRIVWSANRDSPVSNSDKFVFDDKGNVFLQSAGNVVWSTDTGGKGVATMALQDSGNLALIGDNGVVIWQSFSHPTDTLLSNQDFSQGMRLVSDRDSKNNLTYFLEIKSGDIVLSAGFSIPQTYWSMSKENRKTVNKDGGFVSSASLDANSWRIYSENGQNKVLLWQFIFSNAKSTNTTSMAVLDKTGLLTFHLLPQGGTSIDSPKKIPEDQCSTPLFCGSYFVCYTGPRCDCLSILHSYSQPNCQTGTVSFCNSSQNDTKLVDAGSGLSYFALEFLRPFETDLNGCKSSCNSNCSCLALFFQSSSGSCFLLDRIDSFQSSDSESDYVSFVKVLSEGASKEKNGGDNGGNENGRKPFPIVVVIIVVSTVVVITGLLYVSYHYYVKKKRQKLPESPHANSEDDKFFEGLSGMPIRFTFKDLQDATNNFCVKLGQGGFGSVYRGDLPDGSRLAVKKLEGIGQGKKEFRAEVSIIGSIHHLHLVRLKGFCAEGNHRLLAYEFMANGSLDKWIFRKKKENFLLDWDTRFNIALGTAKGLAYLHEDCDSKIIHCDIKPENVLLDANYLAKVSDFGLAKLMTREQSHVFTTMRGTRGYLAPEWITNYAISEKSDVYSYGMVLLEIIGGRKSYDPSETSERAHFPSYAFKMLEEGKLRDILDSNLAINEADERVSIAIKVALWCIQEDMSLRPPMTKVVQMLERVSAVPNPPTLSPLGSRLYANFFKSISEEGTSSGPSDCNSDAYLTAVRLSGPR